MPRPRVFWMTIVPTKKAMLCPNALGSCVRNGSRVNSVVKLLQPDELAAGRALPAEERVAERRHHRVEHEHPEQQQRRGHEEQAGTS